MSNIGDVIDIKSSGQQLVLSSKGDCAEQETVMGGLQSGWWTLSKLPSGRVMLDGKESSGPETAAGLGCGDNAIIQVTW